MGFNIGLTKPAARALRPVIPDNARGLCITAAAGTELATPYSRGTVRTPDSGYFVVLKAKNNTSSRSDDKDVLNVLRGEATKKSYYF